MNWTRAILGLTTFSLLACTSMGCSSTVEEDETEDALSDRSSPGQWVVDMAKVAQPEDQGGYGFSTKLFFGLAPEEYICKPDEAPEACAQKPVLWDQAVRFGPKVSGDEVAFRQPYANDTANPLVKLTDGKIVGPKGKGLNIIPLLKNTDPLHQVHLRKWMKNGDVVTYFHPEYASARQLMDRRVSHVAMHYDYKSPLSGKEYVHHIDNPNNYGPRYNYPPSRKMPFHVFRYQPKGMDAKKAEAYGVAARNWAFLNDDLTPFADFFDLQVQSTKDLSEKFAARLLAGNQSGEVYCSGLAYLNLNLGTNHPLKPGSLTKDYARAETQETFLAADCAAGTERDCVLSPATLAGVPAASLESRGKLIFPPYTTSELANAWLDNTYGELPPDKRAEIAAKPETQAQIAQGLYSVRWSDGDKPATDPPSDGEARTPGSVTATENMKAWGNSYGATLAFGKALKEGNAEGARAIMEQFLGGHELVTKDGQKVGLKELVQRHNSMVPSGGDPEKWVAIDPAKMSPAQILRTLEIAHVANRFVPPRIWLDVSEDRTWLPSGHDPRTESASDLVYVGTVVNCEILSAADGSDADACSIDGAGVGAGSDEFSEGGADSSTYPHYAIPNGGERTHRRFDASTGPALMGKGTRISLRATTFDMSDVRFLLHTPDLYAEGYNEHTQSLFNALPENAIPAQARRQGLAGMSVRDYDAACTAMSKVAASQQLRGTCAPKRAILLDLARASEVAGGRSLASGAIPDEIYTFDLTKVCRVATADAPTMTCPVVSQKADGSGWDFDNVVQTEIKRSTQGLVSATMADAGRITQAAAPAVDPNGANAARDERAYRLCSACGTGGAHFNQWTITIRNDGPSDPAEEPAPAEPPPAPPPPAPTPGGGK